MGNGVYIKLAEHIWSNMRRRHVRAKFASALCKQAAITVAGLTVDPATGKATVPGGHQFSVTGHQATPKTPAPVQAKPAAQPSEWDTTPVQRIHNALNPYLNPAGIAGGAASAVGAGLALHAAFNRSGFLRKLIQMLVGGGIAYGGYRLLTNPAWQQMLNKYTHRAVGAAGNWLKAGPRS